MPEPNQPGSLHGLKAGTRSYLRACLQEDIHPDLIDAVFTDLESDYIQWYNEKHQPDPQTPLDEIEAHIRERFEDLKANDTDSAHLAERLIALGEEYHTYAFIQFVGEED